MALQIKKFSMSRMTIGDCVLFHQGVLADIAEATPAALLPHLTTIPCPAAVTMTRRWDNPSLWRNDGKAACGLPSLRLEVIYFLHLLVHS